MKFEFRLNFKTVSEFLYNYCSTGANDGFEKQFKHVQVYIKKALWFCLILQEFQEFFEILGQIMPFLVKLLVLSNKVLEKLVGSCGLMASIQRGCLPSQDDSICESIVVASWLIYLFVVPWYARYMLVHVYYKYSTCVWVKNLYWIQDSKRTECTRLQLN